MRAVERVFARAGAVRHAAETKTPAAIAAGGLRHSTLDTVQNSPVSASVNTTRISFGVGRILEVSARMIYSDRPYTQRREVQPFTKL
jgi:hypothetical protein